MPTCPKCSHTWSTKPSRVAADTVAPSLADVALMTDTEMFAYFKRTAPLFDLHFVARHAAEPAAGFAASCDATRDNARRAFDMVREQHRPTRVPNEPVFWTWARWADARCLWLLRCPDERYGRDLHGANRELSDGKLRAMFSHGNWPLPDSHFSDHVLAQLPPQYRKFDAVRAYHQNL